MDNEQLKQALLRQMLPCARKGCIREGQYAPVIVVCMVGQTAVEMPIKTAIPMFLCQKHKDECQPAELLTSKGRADLDKAVHKKHGRQLNWDTLNIEWLNSKQVRRAVLN